MNDKVIVVDFETEAIKQRPEYPPKPVSVSIKWPQVRKPEFLAWGHPCENNCSLTDAALVLHKAWKAGVPLLFHNAKFDVDVAETHFGVPRLDPLMYHDTMYLLFLHDPHAPNFQLKPSAERLLGEPPEEQDAVREWVLSHRKELEQEYGEPVTPKQWSAWISKVPAGLVGKYANGDTGRTLRLFEYLMPRIRKADMLEAYRREQKIMPIFLDNERKGLRIDRRELSKAVELYDPAMIKADLWLRKRLKADSLNVDSDDEMAAALKKAGVVTQFAQTATGKDSVSKENLTIDLFKDKKVFYVYGYRNRLATCLRMFMYPWLAQSKSTSYINTSWNQVRQTGKGGLVGTRTGRPSTSSPNFLNLSKSFYDKGDNYEHPKFMDLPELPLVRRFILPDSGHVFCHRDYNQQELRILAHFEDGALMRAYLANPRMDTHDFVRDLILEIANIEMQRRQVKIINFQKIYGGGVPAISSALDITVEKARQFIAAHAKALPGIKDINDSIKAIVKAGEPIVTWGGRRYYPEEPKMIMGRMREFTYKLINYLIQGSAADCTKEALIRFSEAKNDSRFLVTVYDEINISAPRPNWRREMNILKECMEGIEFDVPMLTDGKFGKNWADLKKES